MKKTIKLTEKDLTNLIKRVINEGTYNDEVFPGPEDGGIDRFLKSKPEGGDKMSLDTVEMSDEKQKANEILKYLEFEVRGWLFDKNKRVTQETPGYFLENNSEMVAKIANILRK